MLDFKLHTPIGVGDLLPDETEIKKYVMRKIENVFEGYGYRAVETPMFEYIEVFSDEKMGSISPKEMFRFFDKDGSTLALRSDMTPPIARIAATAFNDSTMPLRFCYYGNAFRDSKSYQGKKCEFSQAGIELMGSDSTEADAETIAIAVKSVLACGINEFKLNIGQVQFFNAVLDEAGFNEDERNTIKDLIANRNYAGVEYFVEDKNIPSNIKKLFLELPRLVGGSDILEYTKTLTKSREAQKALAEMEELYNMLILHGVSKYVSFDMGMVNQLNYYTGIIFRGYTYGTGYSIVDGGRYNNLVKQFGRDIPAVGFVVKVDEVISVLERNNYQFPSAKAKALIASTKSGMASAFKIADIYRKSGVKVENSLAGYTLDENIEYMKTKNMESLIFFKDAINITYIRNDEEKGIVSADITVKDLAFPTKGDK